VDNRGRDGQPATLGGRGEWAKEEGCLEHDHGEGGRRVTWRGSPRQRHPASPVRSAPIAAPSAARRPGPSTSVQPRPPLTAPTGAPPAVLPHLGVMPAMPQ
jgi:hypothetical protein